MSDVDEFHECADKSLLRQHPCEEDPEIFHASSDQFSETLDDTAYNLKNDPAKPHHRDLHDIDAPKKTSLGKSISKYCDQNQNEGNPHEGDEEETPSLSLNNYCDAADQSPINLNIPEKEQSSSIQVFLEMTIVAVALKFALSYLLTNLIGMDEKTWTTYILMHSILFPAGICVGFIRLNKSFLAMPDFEKTKKIRWNLKKPQSFIQETFTSPPFLTSTRNTKPFSLTSFLKGRNGEASTVHICRWALIMKRHPENKHEFQFGLVVQHLHEVQGIGLNVYFKINGKDMFIGYHPFKKSGDVGTTSSVEIPATDDEITVTCQMQCIYFYL